MRPDDVVDRWTIAFGNVAPLGHLCRVALAERWIRVHSLPGSKRYADTTAEYDVVMSRWTTVANDVLGNREDCAFFFCEFPSEPASAVLDLLGPMSVAPTWHPTLASLATGYEQIRIGSISVAWEPDSFRQLLLARADDRIGPILFANLDRATAFAPYDGGADLFFDSAEAVAVRRKEWAAWLSARTDGL